MTLPDPSADRPIIIIGCPRSGTTLLSTMLHSHRRIAIPPETRFAISTYLHRQRFGDLRKPENRRKLGEWITRPKTKFNDLGIDRDVVVKRIEDGPPTIGSAYAALWQEFAAARGKPRWGEKRPSYYQWTGTLLRLFPDAQFVGIVRDPRSCVASLLAARWWQEGFEASLTAWVTAEWHMRRFAARAAADQYHEVRYEDLVTHPRDVLTGVCDYLGEEFDEAMLDHARAAADIVPQRAIHHRLTRGAVDPSRIEAWRSALTPEQIGLIEFVCGRAMRRHGYEPSGIGVRPPRQLVVKFAKDIWHNQYRYARNLARDARLRRRETQPLAAVKAAPAGGAQPAN